MSYWLELFGCRCIWRMELGGNTLALSYGSQSCYETQIHSLLPSFGWLVCQCDDMFSL